MPIQVTCPNCLKRFQVSDQFAGKSGPCPSCKKTIKVPDKSEEVVVHAPEVEGPKDRSGQSVLKPLQRTETDVTRKGMLITGGAIVLAIAAAIALRLSGFFELGDEGWNMTQLAVAVVGAILVAPPLVWAGYTFVQDSELAPYVGPELRNRVLILSAILAALWVLYAFVPAYVLELRSPSHMSFLAFGIMFCIMLGIGAVASVATFELEFPSGLAHAGLYLIAVLGFALMSGIALWGVEAPPL